MAMMSSARAIPGKKEIQYMPDIMYWNPLEISMPREGSVTGTPTPRNDSTASREMACARSMVTMTISGGRQFGKMWRHNMRGHDNAWQRAASTYSRLRSTMAAPRVARAKYAHWTAMSA